MIKTHAPATPWTRWPRLLGLAGLLVGLPLLMATWAGLTRLTAPPAAWMCLAVAVHAGLVLDLVDWPRGGPRTLLAFGFLLACVAGSLWLSVAGLVGSAFGLDPWASALRLGPTLFVAVAEPWLNPANLAWFAAAVALGLGWHARWRTRRAPEAA